jgi:glycosyltransferase involved in cell wall biosynthesis
MNGSMISVVIPTLNSARTLPAVLTALVPAAVDGLVKELIVADGGSADATLEIAEDAGARIVASGGDLALRLAGGCSAARGGWLMLLQADCRLGAGWEAAAAGCLTRGPDAAGYFRLSLERRGLMARLKELFAGLGAPGAAHGLLISRRLYDEVGGYRGGPAPHADLVRRIGAARLRRLDAPAITLAR